jgi:hypothetical protein
MRGGALFFYAGLKEGLMVRRCGIVTVAMFWFAGLVHAQSQSIDAQLQVLKDRGLQYNFITDTEIVITDSASGVRTMKTLREPPESEIRAWADRKRIPVLEIDPALIDTSQWTGWYNYWTLINVGNALRNPTPVLDFDGNGYPEAYGTFGGLSVEEGRAFEVFPNGSSIQRHAFEPAGPRIFYHALDIDGNGLFEVTGSFGEPLRVYEQLTPTSLPTTIKFIYNGYNGAGRYSSREPMVNMDGDSLIDYVHRGADSLISFYYLTRISEYDPSIQNFRKAWYMIPPIDDFYDGYDVGDYDGDGKMEFLQSSIFGGLIVVENTGNDAYQVTYQDTLPFVNMYFQTSGDLDRDGKREFFIGATMGGGNYITVFEADSDNAYSPKFLIHLMAGGSLDDPTYMSADLDNDGVVEAIMESGGYLYVFKSNGDNSYYLWYLRKGVMGISCNFVDMNGDGIKDYITTTIRFGNQWGSNIFLGSGFVEVDPDPPAVPRESRLYQNYPNPFNPSTRIGYHVARSCHVQLTVYDLLGRELATLVDAVQGAGVHAVEWKAEGMASGVYFCRLNAGAFVDTRKMMLVR